VVVCGGHREVFPRFTLRFISMGHLEFLIRQACE
jgi:hypothetical protein